MLLNGDCPPIFHIDDMTSGVPIAPMLLMTSLEAIISELSMTSMEYTTPSDRITSAEAAMPDVEKRLPVAFLPAFPLPCPGEDAPPAPFPPPSPFPGPGQPAPRPMHGQMLPPPQFEPHGGKLANDRCPRNRKNTRRYMVWKNIRELLQALSVILLSNADCSEMIIGRLFIVVSQRQRNGSRSRTRQVQRASSLRGRQRGRRPKCGSVQALRGRTRAELRGTKQATI